MNETTARAQLAAIRLNGLYALLEAGAKKHGIPLAWVLAIGSRETGLRNILGDHGYGHGILQIDSRYHEIAKGDTWQTNPVLVINYGCNLLAGNLAWARRKWPHFTGGQHVKIASAAYNEGRAGAEESVLTGNVDARTTGHDYGASVVAAMQTFERLLKDNPD